MGRARSGFALALAMLALPAGPTGAEDIQTELYILAGQSNMSGRGALAELSAAERERDLGISLFANDGQWRPGLDPLDDETGQIDAISADRTPGVGPGLFFARRIRQGRKVPILLLPCAKGGSTIAEWVPAPGRDTLYGSCVARVRDAGMPPAGMLWYQGESDAATLAKAAAWRAGFETMAQRLRIDLRAPRMPIVVVQLSDPAKRPDRAAGYPGWQAVQAAQRSVALACTAVVSAEGLAQKDDELHLATEGQRVLGRRLAQAMEALRRQGCR
jgi:hypothetical protein